MFSPSCDIDDSIFTLEYSDSLPPLARAAIVGDLNTIKKLISKGHLPQTPDNRGWTAIHYCVAAEQMEALKLILKLKSKTKQHLVNLTTWENITPLLIALKQPKPSLEMIKVLLRAGANPKQFSYTKLSPLHLACRKKGNINIVKLLVYYGADVNVQEDLSFFSPLHFAVCESEDIEVIKYLLDLSNLGLDNIYGRTAFLEACNSDFLEAVKLFLETDKTLGYCRSDIPSLVYASLVGNYEMFELLLHSGADPNQRCKAVVSCKSNDCDLILLDKKSFLPIHSCFTNIEIFKELLKLTHHDILLELETQYYNFALFVAIFGDEIFYETVLQSNLPCKLKTFTNKVLVKFILSYQDIEEILDKFQLLFKYNFALSPEQVFYGISSEMPTDKFSTNFKVLSLLAQMGIPSTYEFENKSSFINTLDSFMVSCTDTNHLSVVRSTYDLLSQSVLTLKQYCRMVVRRTIRATVGNNWRAVKTVRALNLPESLKKFVLFETLK